MAECGPRSSFRSRTSIPPTGCCTTAVSSFESSRASSPATGSRPTSGIPTATCCPSSDRERPDVKGILIWVLIGALVGIVAASFVVPPMLTWYNEAGYLSQGNQPAAMVNLPQVVRYATSKLILGQAIGAAIGAVAFFALGLAFGNKRRKRAAATTPTTPSPRNDLG